MHVFRIYWACYSPKIQFSPLCLNKEMCLITSIAFLDVVFLWIVKQCVCIHFIWLFSPHFSPCVYFTISLNVLQETRNLLNIACERNFTIIIEISDNKSYVKKLSDVNLHCFIILLIAAFPSYRTKTWRVCFSAVAAGKNDIHCQCFSDSLIIIIMFSSLNTCIFLSHFDNLIFHILVKKII